MAISHATPQDFPLRADLEGFWTWDKMHCPRPLTPLTEEFVVQAASAGFCQAMNEFACPFGFTYRTINYYGFGSLRPIDLGAETAEARQARYHETLARMVPRIGELWEQEWLPSILPGLTKARTTDYAALSDAQLLETFE